jgi:uncharacterized protein YhaN
VRIDGWHIDGFGVFVDAAVRDLPPGLTVVHGPNEAGKSTLLAFLRGVLFGFPDGRHKAKRHPPVHGGRHGGRMLLRDESGGRWTIGRHIEADGKRKLTVRRPDGAFGSPDDVAALLGGADATLFANVFAFSLAELDAFDVIGSDEVRDRVFSAGVVGAGRSARAALVELDARRTRLVRPRGRCAARAALDELQAAAVDLDRARADARAVALRRSELDELAREADAARAGVEAARAELLRAEAVLDAWPAWVRLQEAEAALADAPAAPPGVDDRTEAAWTRARAELDAAEAADAEAALALEGADDQLRAVAVDDRLPGIADEARAVFADLAVERGRRARLAELGPAVRAHEAELTDLLARLGPGWDRERIGRADVSIPAVEEVRALGSRVGAAAAAADEARRRAGAAAERLGAAEAEVERVGAELATVGSPPDDHELERDAAALRRLRAARAELPAEAAALTEAERDAAAPPVSPGGRAGAAAAAAAAAVALVAAVVGGLLGSVPVAAVGGVLTPVLAVVAVALAARARRAAAASGAEARAVAEQVVRSRHDRLEARRAELAAAAVALGLDPDPDVDAVEARADRLDRDRLARREAERLTRELERAEAGRADARAARDDAEAARADAEAAHDAEAEAWARWRTEHGAAGDLGPDAAIDLFTTLERARAADRALRRAEAERDEIDRASSAWRDRARAAVRAGGAPDPDDEGLDAAVRQLVERVGADDAARRTRAERRAGRDDLARRREAAAARLATARAAHRSVLDAAGAVDDDDLAAALDAHRRRAALEHERRAAEAEVTAAVGRGPAAEARLAELATDDRATREAAVAARRADLARREAEHEERIRQHQSAREAHLELERSARVPEAAQRVEAARTALAAVVDEWQTLTAARALVADTLARYERERQPAVVARAQGLFDRVTDGHYPRLVLHERELHVVDRAGRDLRTDDLSRGTVELLYLCIRFGLAAEFATHTPLPLVMDDVLVNFDPQRTRALAGALAELADDHQLLLFTSQPTTVEVLRRARPDLRLVELPRYGGRVAPG